MSGLYVHIPFCKQRCIYCGFYSTTMLNLRQRYVDSLCNEMKLRKHDSISTIYIGGGTPSQLSIKQLQQLFKAIQENFTTAFDNIEVTMECNPDDITEKYSLDLSRLPINRISMGIQTFSDERLRFLHRRHTSSQAINAVKLLRHAGFENISIDLMFGFPGEIMEEWETDIEKALDLSVEHISAYSLIYEENTPLFKLKESGLVDDIDDDAYIIMYKSLVSRLEASGYKHYEISNFALNGRESQHNSSYWNGTPYIGIGAAASSYDIETRQNNVADINLYIDSIEHGKVPSVTEILSPTDRYNDLVTTALRTCDGIELNSLEKEHGINAKHYLLSNAKRHLDNGMLVIENGKIHFTMSGIMISDSIMSDLIKI